MISDLTQYLQYLQYHLDYLDRNNVCRSDIFYIRVYRLFGLEMNTIIQAEYNSIDLFMKWLEY